MSVRIEPIFASGLEIVWPLVQEGLSAIDQHGPVEETGEQIRQHLLCESRYRLFFVYRDKEYIGFLITKIDQGPLGSEFCIYKAYKVQESGDLPADIILQLKTIAKRYNCTIITFYSYRRGWERAAMKKGFRKGYTQYILEVA